MLLDEAIDLLTKMLIEEDFKNKKNKTKTYITISKIELYRICIDLLKLLQRIKDMEDL